VLVSPLYYKPSVNNKHLSVPAAGDDELVLVLGQKKNRRNLRDGLGRELLEALAVGKVPNSNLLKNENRTK